MDNPVDLKPAPAPASVENTSGMGESASIPLGVKGWSWGAFFLSWIWALSNNTYIGLLGLIPGVGLVVRVYLGFKGRELAWRNERWNSVEHFNRVQCRWSVWGSVIAVVLIMLALGVFTFALLDEL